MRIAAAARPVRASASASSRLARGRRPGSPWSSRTYVSESGSAPNRLPSRRSIHAARRRVARVLTPECACATRPRAMSAQRPEASTCPGSRSSSAPSSSAGRSLSSTPVELGGEKPELDPSQSTQRLCGGSRRVDHSQRQVAGQLGYESGLDEGRRVVARRKTPPECHGTRRRIERHQVAGPGGQIGVLAGAGLRERDIQRATAGVTAFEAAHQSEPKQRPHFLGEGVMGWTGLLEPPIRRPCGDLLAVGRQGPRQVLPRRQEVGSNAHDSLERRDPIAQRLPDQGPPMVRLVGQREKGRQEARPLPHDALQRRQRSDQGLTRSAESM